MPLSDRPDPRRRTEAPPPTAQPLLFAAPASAELVLSESLSGRVELGRGQYPTIGRSAQCDECVNVLHETTRGARQKAVALGKSRDETDAYVLDQTRALHINAARVRRHIPDMPSTEDVLLCSPHAALWKARDDRRWPDPRRIKPPLRARRV